MRALFLTVMLTFCCSTAAFDYINSATRLCKKPLIMASLIVTCLPVIAGDPVNDLWTYEVTQVQNIIGGIGVALLSVNFLSAAYFWRLSQNNREKVLQERLDHYKMMIGRPKKDDTESDPNPGPDPLDQIIIYIGEEHTGD